jgi:hypothetical protein
MTGINLHASDRFTVAMCWSRIKLARTTVSTVAVYELSGPYRPFHVGHVALPRRVWPKTVRNSNPRKRRRQIMIRRNGSIPNRRFYNPMVSIELPMTSQLLVQPESGHLEH